MREYPESVIQKGGMLKYATMSRHGRLKRLKKKRGGSIKSWIKEHPKTSLALGWTAFALAGQPIVGALDARAADRALNRQYDLMDIPYDGLVSY